MRALGDPDAFPAGDLGAAARRGETRPPERRGRARGALRALAPVARVRGPLPLGGDSHPRGSPRRDH